jgi:glycosyltransferase involved in cell wall biosynthesis
VLELLSVWERLDWPDLFLLLVGSGAGSHDSCDAEVGLFARAHPDRVATPGRVANVHEYLQASDVFVFLSHNEAFSVSLLEALATGLPCIATDVGAAREVVRHRVWGTLVSPGLPPDALIREIDWLQAHRVHWPAMGARAREHIVARYALPRIARRYLELFSTLK